MSMSQTILQVLIPNKRVQISEFNEALNNDTSMAAALQISKVQSNKC